VGATASTYTPVSADVDWTLRVQVSASNSGGGAGPVASAVTPAVVPASSGGGGGGGGSVDVVAGLNASPATPAIGDTSTYPLTAAVKSGAATDVKATINLPAQVTLVSATANRGPGCTGTTTLSCDLDALSGNLVATVTVV